MSYAIDGPLGLVLLCVPLLLLAAVVVWAVRQSRSRPAALPPPVGAAEAASASRPAPRVAQPPAPEAAAQPLLTQPEATQMSASTPPPPPAETPDQLEPAIRASEASGDKAELATLYIRQAAAHLAQQNNDAAASRLRDAIRVAALNGLAAPHALARLELGDIYLSNGDPITACEQWQIARNLFHDLAQPTDRDAVDQRMLANGCPTDWVLTDF